MKHPSMYIQTVNKSTVWLDLIKCSFVRFIKAEILFVERVREAWAKISIPERPATCRDLIFLSKREPGLWKAKAPQSKWF